MFIKIEELLQRLLEEKCKGIKNSIYHLLQIKFAYNSNHIEGNSLTKEQTQYIFDKSRFLSDCSVNVKLNDIFEILNHFEAFDFILEHTYEDLDFDMIKTLHGILKDKCTDEVIGDFKIRPNYIGEKHTTPPRFVESKLEKLLNSYKKIENINFEDIVDFHFKFENIHPFQDGNGRVGRLIMFKECLKNDILPFIVEDENKLFYYRGLKEYEKQKRYLIDTCLLSQDNFSEIVKYFFEEELQEKEVNSIEEETQELFSKLSEKVSSLNDKMKQYTKESSQEIEENKQETKVHKPRKK